MTGMILVYHAS